MGKRSDLDDYDHRRSFASTPEPAPGDGDGDGDRSGDPIFVVQEHDASSHHFDFRIEVDGVLKSWSVPKGPSTDPRDKRLAVATEDHPLDYADFEGTIPEDEYGGGSVIVWDTGHYENRTTDDDGRQVPVADALADGTAELWLEGDKLRGGYALVHARVGGDDDNWLLIKMDDDGADARRRPTRTEPESVLSGRTVEEVGDSD